MIIETLGKVKSLIAKAETTPLVELHKTSEDKDFEYWEFTPASSTIMRIVSEDRHEEVAQEIADNYKTSFKECGFEIIEEKHIIYPDPFNESTKIVFRLVLKRAKSC